MAVDRRQPAADHGEESWYKDAILYELRIRSFADSNDDGIGDLPGLTSRLDYLQDLGVTTLWLLPFYPSPLRDDGYDIADYMDVHPEVGTLNDFKHFLREAHARGLRVVTELVLNHTSDRHPWFQRARLAPPGSPARDYYVWSDTPDRFPEARIIFKDFESSNWTWDPVARAYFWHRFYAHQPDLNYDNPRVRRAMLQVVDFWLSMGVDGLRLDAVPYLYERDGTNCENLAECHGFLRDLRRHVDRHYANRMLLAEANQWPEDAAAYFGAGRGDECHMAFHFPVMPRLFMGIHMEDRFPIVDILQQTPELPETGQWALFLRNHDELTLEMVTDEERDYMYRVYASDRVARLNLGIRRRLAPLLGNDRKKMELMNALLFSLPGTPVVYYGDELGMGDNVYLGDRNGVRTPMQWTGDRNAGFSRTNPQRLFLPVIIDPEYHFETVNVEAQSSNPHSLLWWTKRLIALRKRFHAFGHGSLELLAPRNAKVLAFVRRHGEETILVVCNLSRFVQPVELDLAAYAGRVPVELFGRTDFPRIGEKPYFLTLGPHGFYWFSLERPATRPALASTAEYPALEVSGPWEGVLVGEGAGALADALVHFVQAQAWYRGAPRAPKAARVVDVLPIAGATAHLVLVRLEHQDGATQTYLVPIAFAEGPAADKIWRQAPASIVAHLTARRGGEARTGVLHDALASPAFCRALLDVVSRGRRLKGAHGELVPARAPAVRRPGQAAEDLWPRPSERAEANSTTFYGQTYVLKLLRRIEEGVHPELEISRYLTERRFPNTPACLGSLVYRGRELEPGAVALLSAYVPHERDGWRYTLDWLGRYFDRVLTRAPDEPVPPAPQGAPLAAAAADTPEPVRAIMGEYLERAQLLGQRTAELHVALGAAPADSDFAPEPFTTLYQRSLHQAMRNVTGKVFRLLRDGAGDAPPELRPDVEAVLGLEGRILRGFRAVLGAKLGGLRIRVHGDYHLGQVLHTGRDFVVIDFEGEPSRPIGERRIKRSPLRDVVGMVRSFHYAAHAALPGYGHRTVERLHDLPALEPWARLWREWAAAAFLRGYQGAISAARLLPDAPADRERLLDALLVERMVFEIGYQLQHRPDWLRVPLQGLLERFGAPE